MNDIAITGYIAEQWPANSSATLTGRELFRSKKHLVAGQENSGMHRL